MNSLLAMAWLTTLSDIITEKWPQVIAIFTSSAFITFALTLLGKLILTAIDNHARKKTEKPLFDRFTEMEKSFENRLTQLELKNNELMNNYVGQLDNKINTTLIKYQQTKTELYEEIYNDQEKSKEIIIERIKKQPETDENVIPEQIAGEKQIVSQDVNLETKTANSEYKIAKRVINNEDK